MTTSDRGKEHLSVKFICKQNVIYVRHVVFAIKNSHNLSTTNFLLICFLKYNVSNYNRLVRTRTAQLLGGLFNA